MTIEYDIVQAMDAPGLVLKVSEKLKDGWKLEGPPHRASLHAFDTYTQCMTRDGISSSIAAPDILTARFTLDQFGVHGEVFKERFRQIGLKHTPSMDDKRQDDGCLLRALAVLKIRTVSGMASDAIAEHRVVENAGRSLVGITDGTSRQLLIEAAALIIAEIERRDRAEAKAST